MEVPATGPRKGSPRARALELPSTRSDSVGQRPRLGRTRLPRAGGNRRCVVVVAPTDERVSRVGRGTRAPRPPPAQLAPPNDAGWASSLAAECARQATNT